MVIPPGGITKKLRAKMTFNPQEQFKEWSCSRIMC